MVQSAPVYDEQNYLGDDPQLDRLYDNVQAVVPGVLLPLVKMAAWNTIEDFYHRSTWRREWLDWRMPGNVFCLDFNPFDANWLVCWVLDVYGLRNHYMVRPPALLIDTQRPQSTEQREGKALVALRPTSFDAEFDGQLFTAWFEVILHGVLGRLYGQPGKPYSSPQLMQFHNKSFRAGCQTAKVVAIKEYTNGAGRWAFPYFADGRRKN